MEPVPASTADVAGLADACARAFAGDPMTRWRRPDATLEESETRYRAVLHDYAELGVLWRMPGAAAVASWLSPHDVRRVHEERARRRQAAGTGTGAPDTTDSALWDWMDSHPPAEPFWFLELIAVAPELQSAGLGGALVRHGLTRAADVGLPAFLLTGNERNVHFYQSHGFTVVDREPAPGGGPTVWFMQTSAANSVGS